MRLSRLWNVLTVLLLTALLANFCFFFLVNHSGKLPDELAELLRVTVQPEPQREPWVLTFVGDTMIRAPPDKPDNWTFDKPFSKVRHLLKSSDYIIGNLEGPITTLGRKHDPLHRGNWFSFNVDPAGASALKRVGFSAVCMANNHFNDRGPGGIHETFMTLKEAGIESFGLGETPQTAAKPLLVETPMGVTIGVTGMSQLYYYGEPVGRGQMGVIEPQNEDTAALAVELLHASGAVLKVAFVHWGSNYVMDAKRDKLTDTAASKYVMDPQKDSLEKYAAILADAGFDLIIGSDGSHTAQPFEYVHGVPVLYNIGNFVFLTPGGFHSSKPKKDMNGDKLLPYGMVVHVLVDKSGQFCALELHCNFIDNRSNGYIPRPCRQEEANELFLSLGPHVDHVNGDLYATIWLRQRQIGSSHAAFNPLGC